MSLLIFKKKKFKKIIFKNSVFESIQDNQFNSIDSRSAYFTFGLLGLKHDGTIHALYSNDNTYLIMKQGALEDKSINDKGFDIIENK